MPILNTSSCSHRTMGRPQKTAYRTIGNTRIVSDWLYGRCKKSSLHINRRYDRHRHNRDNGRNGGRGAKGGGNRRCRPCGAPKARGRWLPARVLRIRRGSCPHPLRNTRRNGGCVPNRHHRFYRRPLWPWQWLPHAARQCSRPSHGQALRPPTTTKPALQ